MELKLTNIAEQPREEEDKFFCKFRKKLNNWERDILQFMFWQDPKLTNIVAKICFSLSRIEKLLFL